MSPTGPGWADLPFFAEDWPALRDRLAARDAVAPPAALRFRALDLTAPEDVRVVILGQDPYPTPGHATGLAFSVPGDLRKLPPSLRNIFAEMRDDIGCAPESGDLTHWAQQGVLLLNTALSVDPGQPGSHARWGWDRLVAQVLDRAARRPCAFLLWGNHAQKVARPFTGPEHLVIETAHPSPLAARRGFFGSRPFGRINDWLEARGEAPIDWCHASRGDAQTLSNTASDG
ncbi:uracil-DNA glycosylase [Limimaricola pyoseonensis]|uniref:Uracil-DNA glycosylase n=1 Tax=Limimaricola pyoseonensis TaxID=521013 RepID=A0A1G7GWU8_9RHOB|nr:uracil-DNA glycosylase [Limimaricola pyoseonensis]SDE92617.1 Uracil-DNA glycosylase [Limimaricola pyoseonensis]